jgi:hypothetical protein
MLPQIVAENLFAIEPLSSPCKLKQQNIVVFQKAIPKEPKFWRLDCGNRRESGQVLLGSTDDPKMLQRAFPMESLCQCLPSLFIQCPDLLIAQPEELIYRKLSCAELALANSQGLIVNQRVAAEAADFLDRLLVRRNLRRFATYFDLASGSVKHYYISPETIGAFTKMYKTAM